MYYQDQQDESLIGLLSNSDDKAFEEIYRRYFTVVFKYAVCKVHTQQIAEDICQDVFVSLWQRRKAVSIENLEAYLIQATKYGILNQIRLKIKDKKHHEQAGSDKQTGNETENSMNLRSLMKEWETAVNKLPAKTQTVFRLSKFDNFSNKEIAVELQITEKAVEYHITKSFKIIRLVLRDFMLFIILCISF